MDFGRCAWRSELYEQYKAGRKKPSPGDFLPQIQTLETALPAFGFHIVKSLAVEADDLIGALSNEIETRTDERLLILSSDHDLWQLITDRVAIYDLQDNCIIGLNAATERLGFLPERLVEFKALAGDTSDNIPGAKGIGEKGAKELLEAYPNLQELLIDLEIHPEKAKSALLKKVATSTNEIKLAGKLCTIAQYKDQLFTQDAQEQIEKAVQFVLDPKFSNDEVAMAAFADLWRTDGRHWEYAFKIIGVDGDYHYKL